MLFLKIPIKEIILKTTIKWFISLRFLSLKTFLKSNMHENYCHLKTRIYIYIMDKCMRVAAMYRAQMRVDSLSLNDCADQLSLQEATSTLCHRVVRDVFWHELRPSASLPLQADSHSRSSFVPSRVTRSQLSSAARERHVSIVGASERASKRANERTGERVVPFWELLSANQRVLRAVGRTGVSPAIVYLRS